MIVDNFTYNVEKWHCMQVLIYAPQGVQLSTICYDIVAMKSKAIALSFFHPTNAFTGVFFFHTEGDSNMNAKIIPYSNLTIQDDFTCALKGYFR